jgi:hypothetical protein
MCPIAVCQKMVSRPRPTPAVNAISRALSGLESAARARHHIRDSTGKASPNLKKLAVTGSAPDRAKKIAEKEMIVAPARAAARVLDPASGGETPGSTPRDVPQLLER